MAIWNINLKKITDKLKQNPKLEFGIYAVIILLAVCVYFSGTKPNQTKAEEPKPAAGVAAERSLEERLTQTLCKIDGAGMVEVMISYATSEEIVPAMSVDKQTSETSNTESTKPMTIAQKDGGDEPMVLYERQPTVLGAIIVAEGAHDIGVRMDLLRAAQAVLGVSASQVEVFAMKSEKSG